MKNKRELKGNQLCHFLPSFYQNAGHLQIAQELLQSCHQSLWLYQMMVAAMNKYIINTNKTV